MIWNSSVLCDHIGHSLKDEIGGTPRDSYLPTGCAPAQVRRPYLLWIDCSAQESAPGPELWDLRTPGFSQSPLDSQQPFPPFSPHTLRLRKRRRRLGMNSFVEASERERDAVSEPKQQKVCSWGFPLINPTEFAIDTG